MPVIPAIWVFRPPQFEELPPPILESIDSVLQVVQRAKIRAARVEQCKAATDFPADLQLRRGEMDSKSLSFFSAASPPLMRPGP